MMVADKVDVQLGLQLEQKIRMQFRHLES